MRGDVAGLERRGWEIGMGSHGFRLLTGVSYTIKRSVRQLSQPSVSSCLRLGLYNVELGCLE
jgi:hypothetical protein